MKYIDESNIENLSVGAAFLGTGGGGDPYIGKMMALNAIRKHGPVRVISASDVEADGYYLPSASMGAPSVMAEKFAKGDEFIRSFEKLSNYLGIEEIAGTFPMEAGGVNSMIPIAVAAQTGLPLVDTDGMGRAFPELQMTTFHLGGIPATPMTITDEKGNIGVFEAIDNKWTERLARVVTSEMGGSAMVSIYPCTGKQLQDNGIHGIMSLCERIGGIIRQSKDTKEKLEELLELTSGYELFNGKIVDVNRTVKGGFNFGEAKLDGLNKYSGKNMIVDFQNENLIARLDGEVLATTPDLIMLVDLETLMPITTESLKYGQRVRVLAQPCDDKWRTDLGIETVGPRYFGYNLDYIPVEELNKEAR